MKVLGSSAINRDLFEEVQRTFPGVEFARLDDDKSPPIGFADAEVLVRSGMSKQALAHLVDRCPNLRWIHTCSAGFDYVLIPEVVGRGVRLTRSASSAKVAIAEYVLAAILSFAKKLPQLHEAQARRNWIQPRSESVQNKTVLVVGVGAIGLEVGRLCSAVGMRTIGVRRTPADTEHFEEIVGADQINTAISRADYVVLCCPLTSETRGLMNSERFSLMRPTSLLVNVARGEVVEINALRQALAGGMIAGACLDVFEEEPLPEASWLWTEAGVMVTPHCAYNSEDVQARALREFSRNLDRYLNGWALENEIRDVTLGY